MSRRYEAEIIAGSSSSALLAPGPTIGNSFRRAASTTDFNGILIPMPTNLSNGDFMVLVVSSFPKQTMTVTSPGWTFFVSNEGAGAGDLRQDIWWKRRDGTEGTTIIVTAGGSCEMFGAISAYFGVAPTGNPIISSNFTHTSIAANGATFTIAAHTPPEPEGMVVGAYTYSLNGRSFTPTTGNQFLSRVERVDNPGGGGFVSGGLFDFRLPSGFTSTDLTTVTLTPVSTSTRQAIGQHLVFRVEDNNTYRDSTFATGNGATSVVITKPVGLMVDDIMVACVSAETAPVVFTPPAGWTSIRSDTIGTLQQDLFWRRADAGDVAAINFTFNTGAPADIVGIISAYSGCVTAGSPVDTSAATLANALANTVSLPSITPTQNNTLDLSFYGVAETSRTWNETLSNTSTFREREQGQTGGVTVSLGLSDERRYDTSTIPVRTMTMNGAALGPFDRIGQVVLLKLASSQTSTFEGEVMEVEDYEGVRVFAASDVDSNPGGLKVLFSNSSALDTFRETDRFTVLANQAFSRIIPARAHYARIRYINGPVTQTRFQLETIITPRGGQADIGNQSLEPHRAYRATATVQANLTTEVLRLSDTDAARAIKVHGYGAHLNELATPQGGSFLYQVTLVVGGTIVASAVLNSDGRDTYWFPVEHNIVPGQSVVVSVIHSHDGTHSFAGLVETLEY